MYKYETRKLNFQLVPKTAWYDNLRGRFFYVWPEISQKIRSSRVCSICGTQTGELDAHEVWEYDDENHIQSLKDIIPVCKACHNTIHIGLAQVKGTEQEAIDQYIKVNNITLREADIDVNEAAEVWRRRSEHNWKLDENQLAEKITEITGIKCDPDGPIKGRYYCHVPFSDKDRAKSMGAKWDAERKLWYFSNAEKKNAYIASVLIEEGK